MFKNFKLFKLVYIDNGSYGCRTTKRGLGYSIKNNSVIDEVISHLFFEVPSIYRLGEGDYEKHYLLKARWEVIYHFYICGCLIKSKPLYIFKWVWYCSEEILYIPKSQRYYKNPNE